MHFGCALASWLRRVATIAISFVPALDEAESPDDGTAQPSVSKTAALKPLIPAAEANAQALRFLGEENAYREMARFILSRGDGNPGEISVWLKTCLSRWADLLTFFVTVPPRDARWSDLQSAFVLCVVSASGMRRPSRF
jgi:hypothetical protein